MLKLFQYGSEEELDHFKHKRIATTQPINKRDTISQVSSRFSKTTKVRKSEILAKEQKQYKDRFKRNQKKRFNKIREIDDKIQYAMKTKPNLTNKPIKRTLRINNILKKMKWNDDVTTELRKQIEDIIKDIASRINVDIAIGMAEILEEYQDYIGKYKYDIGCIKDVEYRINVKSDINPIKKKPIPYALEHAKEIKQTVDTLLEFGMLIPYLGPWGSLPFMVYNSDGSTRMVVDYKDINKITIPESYPTPSVPDITRKFHGKTIFSSLDIMKAFFNIKVAKESMKYTAFVTPFGAYQWTVMPFGGTTAPGTWARDMI